MGTFLKMAVVGILATAFVGCAQTGSAAGSGPCASCSEGVASVKKTSEKRAFCVINGKQVDCTKNPAECPACAKMK